MYQLMKKHYERYTPEMVSEVTASPRTSSSRSADGRDDAPRRRTMTHLYALGWTQHTNGSQNIRAMAMFQLLLGNMGVAAAA